MFAAVLVHFESTALTRSCLQNLTKVEALSAIVLVLHSEFDAQPLPMNVTVINRPNSGFASGLNAAMSHLKKAGNITDVLIVNPDVTSKDEDIARLLIDHQDSGADCTFAPVREGNRVIHGYRLTRFGTMKLEPLHPQYFPGTCFVIKTDAWFRAGGMDESYFHYFEDADFCLRLKSAGCSIRSSAVTIDHIGKSGSNYAKSALPFFAIRNHLRFARKLGITGPIAFTNIAMRHLFYILRWPAPWRALPFYIKGLTDKQEINVR